MVEGAGPSSYAACVGRDEDSDADGVMGSGVLQQPNQDLGHQRRRQLDHPRGGESLGERERSKKRIVCPQVSVPSWFEEVRF